MCSAAYERWRRVLGLQLGWHGEPSRLHLVRAGQCVAGVHTRLLGIRVGCGHMLGRLWWRPDKRPCTGCVWTGCSGVGRLAHVRTLPVGQRCVLGLRAGLGAVRRSLLSSKLPAGYQCRPLSLVRPVRGWGRDLLGLRCVRPAHCPLCRCDWAGLRGGGTRAHVCSVSGRPRHVLGLPGRRETESRPV